VILLLEGFDAYATAQLPASNKWTVATNVVIGADEGRSGFSGDNAAFFTTAIPTSTLSTPIAPTAVGGVVTLTLGLAFRDLMVANTVTLASFHTAISHFDLIATFDGDLRVDQVVGGVLLGTICEGLGVLPTSGGGYIGFQVSFDLGNAAAVQIQVSDQNGDMNPVAQGALLALLAGETPSTLQFGGGVLESAATWWLDDVYLTDGVAMSTAVVLPSGLVYNDSFLGNVHVQTIYASADGSNLSLGNTPWTPNAGSVSFNRINEHPPDEDTTYLSADTSGQITTCLFASPIASPFGKITCTAFAPIFGLQWDGRLRNTGSTESVRPIIRRLVTGLLAGDVVAFGAVIPIASSSYLYYPQVFDRNPTLNGEVWMFDVFLGVAGVPETTEFGVQLV
jgi:hypothetical protein